MLMRLTRPWPVLCFACIGILGVLLLADITTRLAMIAAGPASSQRLQGSHPFWLPWLQTRLAHATGYPTQPSLDEFLQEHCSGLAADHQPLVDDYLHLWADKGVDAATLSRWPGQAYIYRQELWMGPHLERGRLMPTYLHMMHEFMQQVRIPDMQLPMNAADESLAGPDPSPMPLLSFCRPQGSVDILIPNTIEGNVFHTHAHDARRGGPADSELQSGPGDKRKAMAVWRGTVVQAYAGVRKGRWALLELGRERPDVIDSGTSDWDEKEYGADKGRKKPMMSFSQQVEGYKYLVWAPGNCASVRLAKQLAADALVLKLNSVEHEWYYPLLQPYQQFVPVWVNTTGPQGNLSLLNASSVGIAEAVRWAEGHPQEVRRIVADANAFARRHLSVRGRDCYFARLLRGWHSLQRGVDPQPPPGSELFRPG